MSSQAKNHGPQKNVPADQKVRPARVQGIDQIWIINLDRRKDRLERFMQGHPEMLGRINRLPAYDGTKLALTPDIARLFAPNNFDWHKPTMGCAMSHLALWQKLADDPDDNAAYLILEDDARLAPSWVAAVEKAFHSSHIPDDWEVLFLGGILPKYCEFFERNIAPLNQSVARVKPDCKFGTNPAGYFHFCAYAYLLNKRGAQRLLDLVASGGGVWMQADFLACYTTPDLRPARPVYFLNPLPAHSFQDEEEGLARPYSDENPDPKVDSDIWKVGERFAEDKVVALLDVGRDLDIRAALGLPPVKRKALVDASPVAGPVSVKPPRKKVGLVCVTKDSAEKLKVTLESIVRNTDPALYELHVFDNASSDTTRQLCSGSWPENIHFTHSEQNLGWVGAINHCLPALLEHQFVGFLNDDIEVGPRWLEHLVGVLERHAEVGAVGPLTSNDRDWQGYDKFNAGPIKRNLPALADIDRNDVPAMAAAMAGFNPGIKFNDAPLAFFCVLFRSEALRKVGPLDMAFNELYLGDDDDYCKRILAAGYVLALSFNAYVAHHSGSRSLLVKNYEERCRSAQHIIARKQAVGLYDRKLNSAQSVSANPWKGGRVLVTLPKGFRWGFGDQLLAGFFTRLLLDNGIDAVLDECNPYASLLKDIPTGSSGEEFTFYYNSEPLSESLIDTVIRRFRERFGYAGSMDVITPYVPVRFESDDSIQPVDVVLVTTSGPHSSVRNWPYFEELKQKLRERGVSFTDLNDFGYKWSDDPKLVHIAANLIYKCKVFVGLETGASHFASGILAQKKRGFNLIIQSGYVPFSHWTKHYNGLFKPLEVDVECKGCLLLDTVNVREKVVVNGKTLPTHCEKDHYCMKAIAADFVLEKVLAGVSSRPATRLCGLYTHPDIPHLEKNHRLFAERNALQYSKYSIRNFYEKWALVYRLLEAHADETLIFVDAFSYFASQSDPPDFPELLLIQEVNGRVMDNLFVVRSCVETRRIFHEILRCAEQQFAHGSHLFKVPLPSGLAKLYGYQTDGGVHFNVDPHFTFCGKYLRADEVPLGFDQAADSSRGNETDRILAITYGSLGWDACFWNAAEILCFHRRQDFAYKQEPGFEVVNPGRPRALVTLSCSEPGLPAPDYAVVSEISFRRYAESRDVTLYIYKGIPEVYTGLHSTWTKPYLVLQHLPSHEYVSWVDADILISRDFPLPEGEDVIVYNDPGAWLFNAGFMTFRNSAKTVDYLHAVIARCESIGDRSSLYINGSDQTQFIEEYKIHFPDALPRSNLTGNTPVILDDVCDSGPGLWHFMGLNPPAVRAIVMDYYDRRIAGQITEPKGPKSRIGPGTTATPPDISETSKHRDWFLPYTQGFGMDVGFGGDPLTANCIAFDLPQPYTSVGMAPQHLGGNARVIPLSDNTLDWIYNSHLIEDFTYDEQIPIVQEWLRVLKPGGRLLILAPDQQRFLAHYAATGQRTNENHKESDYSLATFKRYVLAGGNIPAKILAENNFDDYSWAIALKKMPESYRTEHHIAALALRTKHQSMNATKNLQAELWRRFGTKEHPAEWDGIIYGGGKLSQRYWEYFKAIELLELDDQSVVLDVGGGSPEKGAGFFATLLSSVVKRVIVFDKHAPIEALARDNITFHRADADYEGLKIFLEHNKSITHISCLSVFEHVGSCVREGIVRAVNEEFSGATFVATLEYHASTCFFEHQLTARTLSRLFLPLTHFFPDKIESSAVWAENAFESTTATPRWYPLALRFTRIDNGKSHRTTDIRAELEETS